jgi:GDP-4-dehydro-6-deoxy-D-mannose reductase
VKRRRALITGATGFSGRHLIRYLRSQSIEIAPISLRGNQLTDVRGIADIVGKAQPDYVFHLAGVAASASAEDFFRVNVLYAESLLRGLDEARLGNRPVLLVGTAAEYGLVSSENLPITEETPCQPYNLYGITKLAQSLLGLAAQINENRPVIIARPFNIIGQDLPEHLALASFRRQIAAIKAGTNPPVLHVGNLSASRDFIDIEDVVRIYWSLAQNSNAYGNIFNLCTGIATSLRTVVDLLIKASGVEIEVRPDPARLKPVDIPVHYGSNRKLHEVIGDFAYKPVSDLVLELAQ